MGNKFDKNLVRQYVEVVDDSLKPIRPVYVTICKMVCLINVVDHQIDEHSKWRQAELGVTWELRNKHQGSISPNFVHHAKSCRRMAFGKKFSVQFHQLNIKAKITSKLALTPFAIRQICAPKKLFILHMQKVRTKCWWNRPLLLQRLASLIFFH